MAKELITPPTTERLQDDGLAELDRLYANKLSQEPTQWCGSVPRPEHEEWQGFMAWVMESKWAVWVGDTDLKQVWEREERRMNNPEPQEVIFIERTKSPDSHREVELEKLRKKVEAEKERIGREQRAINDDWRDRLNDTGYDTVSAVECIPGG